MKKEMSILAIVMCGIICLSFYLVGSVKEPSLSSPSERDVTISKTSSEELDSAFYASSVAAFKKVEVDELKQMIDQQDSFYLFAGRASCPYCHLFLSQFNQIEGERPLIYYLDTEERENEAIQAFRTDYSIKTVPHLSYFYQGEKLAYLEKGSQASPEEIEEFLRIGRPLCPTELGK